MYFYEILAHLSKISLYDDNSSFFSRNSFNSFLKFDGTSDHSQAMSSAQLPDLLNGTVNNNNIGMGIDAKQLLKNLGSFGNNESSNHDDWENAFKYLMSKNNFNCKQTNYDDNQQEDWLQYQELRKQTSNFHNGSSHFNMFNSN